MSRHRQAALRPAPPRPYHQLLHWGLGHRRRDEDDVATARSYQRQQLPPPRPAPRSSNRPSDCHTRGGGGGAEPSLCRGRWLPRLTSASMADLTAAIAVARLRGSRRRALAAAAAPQYFLTRTDVL
jgi:hypothetical protein